MKAIYVPKGKAGEYADFALNLYKGCNHGCTYCYAPNVVHRSREDFHGEVGVRKNIVEMVRREAPGYAGKKVFLCFTCDPYTKVGEFYGPVTRQILVALLDNRCGVEILTKAGKESIRDFDLLAAAIERGVPCAYGVTLTTMNYKVSELTEPGAASPVSRLEALALAKDLGIDTFVSLEPVLNPVDGLDVIEAVAPWTNRIKIGRWNYDKAANDIDWRQFALDAISLCEKLGLDYMIKRDLAVFLED